ncbi:MAG: terpene cyclase/mutase family protein [Pirellulales bacterium]|nr:terpene cyclase/mutase family protein [Pirellulales bacterium]
MSRTSKEMTRDEIPKDERNPSDVHGVGRVLSRVSLWLGFGGLLGCLGSVGIALGQEVVVPPLATQGPKPAAITPPSSAAVHTAIERGVDFLLEVQMKHGAWGSAHRTKGLNIYAPVPGSHHAFRTAVTSLSLMALLEARDQFDGPRRKAIEEAIDRGQQWLLQHGGKLRRAEAEAIYNIWGHAYALHALSRLHARAEGDTELQAKLLQLCEYQADRLRRYQSINGGWGYYDMNAHTRRPSSSSISFTTATALIALREARELGVAFPAERTQQALDSIVRQRFPDFAYAYGEYLRLVPRYGINRPAGSLGRSQACNLALRLYGDPLVSDEVLKTWLNRLYARNGWLSIGRKYPIPHESHFAIAGYFYYYGHFYAAMCIAELPESERPYFQDHLANVLLPLQEKDGSWWDYPLYNYHQQYGTAMTICALIRCQHATKIAADAE